MTGTIRSKRNPAGRTNDAPQKHDPMQDLLLVEAARGRLASIHSLRRWVEDVKIHCHEGTLRLEGRLPSFYLKQVLQTALRDLPGCHRIENAIHVEL